MKRRWHKVYFDGYKLTGKSLPRDGQWAVWKNENGIIETCRFKFDIFDYFHPRPTYLKSTNIMYWRERPMNCAKVNRNKTCH